eukprot:scaffold39786_cov21-Tisochrysis_lutea.AAC.2
MVGGNSCEAASPGTYALEHRAGIQSHNAHNYFAQAFCPSARLTRQETMTDSSTKTITVGFALSCLLASMMHHT